MTEPHDALRTGDALLIVDAQKDFCPGGALPVDRGDAIVPVLNEWIAAAQSAGIPIIASRDWHPREHVSFESAGGSWPAHCVQDTEGASFHPNLRLPEGTLIATKGTRFDKDQYSAFDETRLAKALRDRGILHLWIGGHAQDVYVRDTALDAIQEGFEVHLIPRGSQPLSLTSGKAARQEMESGGVVVDSPRNP
jgi:nicotinamidase/pyrazinamidase